MPDTGAAAGQQVEKALQLTRFGSALSYANLAAFQAVGGDLVYRAAQATQSFTPTIAPHADAQLAARGWHLVVFTLINGQGPLLVQLPPGSGWSCSPLGWEVGCEQVDLDQLYNAQLTSVGVSVADSTTITQDYSVIEGDSFAKQFTARETGLTNQGFTCENLTDGTLSLACEIRLPTNRQGLPDAYAALTVVTASTGSDPVLRLSWGTFPAGMLFAAGDTDVTPADFQWDGQAYGAQAWNVTAIVTGASGTFTVAGDRRRWLAKGGTFNKTATGAATWTIASVAYVGTDTIITVTGTIVSGVVDGTVSVPITITMGEGVITVRRQETLTP